MLLIKSLCGSRLYDIHREDSDYDYRGVVVTPLRDYLYQTAGNRHTKTLQGDDLTLYEFSHFMKLAEKGNATILETIVGEKVGGKVDFFGTIDWRRVIDPDAAIGSWKGYANAQLKKHVNEAPKTAGKSIASAYVTYQLTMLALQGNFNRKSLLGAISHDYIVSLRNGEHVEDAARFLRDLVDIRVAVDENHYDPEYVKDVILSVYSSVGGE